MTNQQILKEIGEAGRPNIKSIIHQKDYDTTACYSESISK